MNESPEQKSRASGSGPSKSKTGVVDIERVMRDERVVRLRRDGLTYSEIAAAEGIGRSTVGDVMKKWLAERGPAAELVEQLRALDGDRLDEMQAKYWPHLMRTLRDSDGDIIYQGAEDNRTPLEVPDPAVSQQVLRIMERRAKLFGLDMQVGVIAPPITREALAELFCSEGFEVPIDVDGEELADDQQALGLGAGD